MRERMEFLINKVQRYEQRKINETDTDIRKFLDDSISESQKELADLQEKFQPERFEQVIGLMIEKCQELIDSNDIFVDGDKDIFLRNFIEPCLKINNSNAIRDTVVVKFANMLKEEIKVEIVAKNNNLLSY